MKVRGRNCSTESYGTRTVMEWITRPQSFKKYSGQCRAEKVRSYAKHRLQLEIRNSVSRTMCERKETNSIIYEEVVVVKMENVF